MLGAVSPDSFDTLHSYSNTFQMPFVTPWFPEKVNFITNFILHKISTLQKFTYFALYIFTAAFSRFRLISLITTICNRIRDCLQTQKKICNWSRSQTKFYFILICLIFLKLIVSICLLLLQSNSVSFRPFKVFQFSIKSSFSSKFFAICIS